MPTAALSSSRWPLVRRTTTDSSVPLARIATSSTGLPDSCRRRGLVREIERADALDPALPAVQVGGDGGFARVGEQLAVHRQLAAQAQVAVGDRGIQANGRRGRRRAGIEHRRLARAAPRQSASRSASSARRASTDTAPSGSASRACSSWSEAGAFGTAACSGRGFGQRGSPGLRAGAGALLRALRDVGRLEVRLRIVRPGRDQQHLERGQRRCPARAGR